MDRASLLGLLVACSSIVACGGATPAPKDADDAPAKATPATDTSKGAAATDDKSAPADAPAKEAAPTSAQPPSSASGDIKVPADDPWMASHQMPTKDVMATMRTATAKVQGCFHEGLKRDPSTSGEVKIRFVITNDGAVRAWKDDASSMSDGDVTQCVGEALNKLKFPKQKSPGDAWGSYSIHFGN